MWRAEDPPGHEALKVKYEIVPYTRGRVLDLGAGMTRVYGHFTTVDNLTDSRLFGHPMKPDVIVGTCEDLSIFADRTWDGVFSSHLLEHLVDTERALAEWWRVVKVGGHLVLYLPHADFYPNINQPGANPDHKHDFRPNDIKKVMREVASDGHGWDLLVNENRNEGREYSFLQVYRKRGDRRCEQPCEKDLGKTACVCRFGGFGDQMMASNVLPALKRQGFHITMMTTPKGRDMLKHDPNIDAWIVQDPDQVPNVELGEYWKAWTKKFDRFVNFSESVEGTYLALPGRANHAWPTALRQARLGTVNYLEHHAALAEVPLTKEAKFYPSDEESARAKAFVAAMGDGTFPILWVLAGSSIHKTYPHMDRVIAAVMLHMPEAHVILVGDPTCAILEQGWEQEPRVHCMSGKLSIRDTIALAQACPVVVGPETGVLNAIAFEDNAKVIFMSHSSIENLTRDWVNTTNLEPAEKPACYPCHRLHYGDEFCHVEEQSHTALCAFFVEPADVYEALEKVRAAVAPALEAAA